MSVASMSIFEIARLLLARYRIIKGSQIVMAQNQVAERTALHLAEVAAIEARINALEASNG